MAAVAGRRFGISCNSGTAGLHMVVRALGMSDGDAESSTPFSSSRRPTACSTSGSGRGSWTSRKENALGLDPQQVEDAAGSATVGVLAVQVFGRPCRIEDIAAIAQRRG